MEIKKMDKDKLIEVGDLVSVNFDNIQFTLCRKAKVLCVPCTPIDSWIFEDFDDHQIHYVSEGCRITLLSKAMELNKNRG